MKHIFAFLLAALLAFSAQAEKKLVMERPDFNKIKAETLNPKSSRYYPTLIKKYMSADTSMT
ncbi:MAG: hypothetical protein SO127_00800, partial [Muribaculaceae bacterium]|nr:hypothetical protein [Muribaculaceae bacterium]